MNQKPTCRKNSGRAAGFTLIELLVVITIIGVLLAIGVPLMSKMRARTGDSQCLAQMRVWSTVIATYSADNAGKVECRNWNSIGDTDPSAYVTYFAGDNTHDSGYQTLAKMRCCPTLTGDAAKSGNGNSLTCYSMTDPTGSSDGKKVAGYSLATIKNPSRFVIMIETVGGKAYINSAAGYTSTVLPLTVAGTARHQDRKVSTLLGDFSVQSLSGTEIKRNIPSWANF